MMEPGSITLDRESFKALASEVRVEVLKQLEAQRMTVTDLSNAMGLAKPTLLEHLDRLVSAGLIVKKDEGRKWIYYELTRRGRHILHPHQVKILISLALSILLVSAGMFAILAAATLAAPAGLGPQTGGTNRTAEGLTWLTGDSNFAEGVAAGQPGPWGLVVITLAIIPALIALWYYRASRNLIESVRLQLERA